MCHLHLQYQRLHQQQCSHLHPQGKVPLCDSNNKNTGSITDYFRENEDIVLCSSKDDVLNKIQYYLDNPEERERIAENGRNIVYQHFTYKAVAERTMGFIKKHYSDNKEN